MKTAGLFLALLALVSPTFALAQIEAEPSPFFLDDALTEFIKCSNDQGGVSGTGSRIDANTVLTAYHVVAGRTCVINGFSAELVYSNGDQDIAVLKTQDTSPLRLAISCDGFKRGKSYYATGWAFGERKITNRYIGLGIVVRNKKFRGLERLKGMSFPGMSGSAVVDENGMVVGILNAGNTTGSMLSRSLSTTYLCGTKA
jgi:S1-C subfamily serine protease